MHCWEFFSTCATTTRALSEPLMVLTIPQTRSSPRVRWNEADASEFVNLYIQASGARGTVRTSRRSARTSCTTSESPQHNLQMGQPQPMRFADTAIHSHILIRYLELIASESLLHVLASYSPNSIGACLPWHCYRTTVATGGSIRRLSPLLASQLFHACAYVRRGQIAHYCTWYA